MRLEKLHLDCASSAPSHHGSTQQWPLLHRKDYLQGTEIPTAISPSRLVPIKIVTLSPRRLAEQPLRLSHDTESPAQGPSSRSQAARAEDRRRWRPSTAERCRWRPSAADGGPAECSRGRPSAADGGRAPPMVAERRRWRSSAADGGHGGRAPQMAVKRSRWLPSSADGGRAPQMAVKRRPCQAPPMAAERRRWQPSSADGCRAQCHQWPSPVMQLAASTARQGSVKSRTI
jgi:hypothetical protein